MITITPEILKAIAPLNKKSQLLVELSDSMNEWFPVFDIDTKGEVCHFLAQAAHETASFNALKEAGGPTYFKKYEGRQDLGNTTQGDGIKYPGRGIFMTTGRTNYQRAEDKAVERFGDIPDVHFVSTPQQLELPQYAVWSACLYWQDKSFNDIANQPDHKNVPIKIKGKLISLPPVKYISYRINGGYNGLEERIAFYERAKKVIK